MPGRSPATAKKVGRPSAFDSGMAERILKLAADGLTDFQIAAQIGVPVKTLRNWKGRHAEFRDALKSAKNVADELVVASLFRRAVGFDQPAIKIMQYEGAIITERYVERFPPDTTACIFWLKNRQPELWRDAHKHEHAGKDGGAIEHKVTAVDVAKAAAKAVKHAGEASETF